MNLIEARKQAHDGWVRSPSRTQGNYIRFTAAGYKTECGEYLGTVVANDLDAEDWEPKPAPPKLFEAEVLVDAAGVGIYYGTSISMETPAGWRKIRVREVVE